MRLKVENTSKNQLEVSISIHYSKEAILEKGESFLVIDKELQPNDIRSIWVLIRDPSENEDDD